MSDLGWAFLCSQRILVSVPVGGSMLGRLGESMLFCVDGLDSVVIAAASTGMTILALAAAILPARRAARTDPMENLRAE